MLALPAERIGSKAKQTKAKQTGYCGEADGEADRLLWTGMAKQTGYCGRVSFDKLAVE